ncbi:ABC transporter permease [Streptomyces acidiscabies]|uniref:ABC transporter permease n=1 Tax=Streptomyces acidiscabies TaxID=42234 RepID=UPI00067AEE01|nr:ABC transporter permease [Streptomyces acidiscabies]
MITTLWGAVRFQLAIARTSPDVLLILVRAPLMTMVLLSISEYSGRRDLAAGVVLAPVLMALWDMTLLIAGEVINRERSWGTLEALVATPARFFLVVLGRIGAVTTISMVSFAEAWLVARYGFGIHLTVVHGTVFVLCVLASGLAMAGTATLMSALFVLAPSARLMQNTLTYPFYLLAGVLVPVSMLPEWLRPLSSAVFLSWSAELLRESLSTDPVPDAASSLAVITLLGLAGTLAGLFAVNRALRQARAAGTLSEV